MLEASSTTLISTATLVEASIVSEARRRLEGVRELDLLIEEAHLTVALSTSTRLAPPAGDDFSHTDLLPVGIELVPVDAEQAGVARRAFSRFGKGRPPAGLSFGYCFSYPLAKTMARPLLPTGADLTRTDLSAQP